MNHYVRGDSTATTGPQFEYFRDWVPYDTDRRRTPARRSPRRTPREQLGLLGPDRTRSTSPAPTALTADQAARWYARVGVLRQRLGRARRRTPRPPALEGDTVNNAPTDAPGTFAAFTSPVLIKAPAEVVGAPVRHRCSLDAPVAAQTQAGGPSGQLVLFAKVYDVAPDGTKVLKNRLISPHAGHRRDQAGHVAAAGHRAPVRRRSPDPGWSSPPATSPTPATRRPAGHGQHQPGSRRARSGCRCQRRWPSERGPLRRSGVRKPRPSRRWPPSR